MSSSALLIQNHPIYKFTKQTFSNAEVNEDQSCTRKVTQVTLKVLGILAASAARVSMVNVCLTAGQKITGETLKEPGALSIGITNSFGTVLGSGLISVWAVNNLINEITRKMSPEERKLFSKHLPEWQRCIITIVALTGGLTAQIPMAVGSYYASVPPVPPDFSAISQIADFARPSYSIYNRLNALSLGSCQRCRSPRDKDLIKLKENLIAIINAKKALLDTHSEERTQFISEIEEIIKNNGTGEQLLIKILELAVKSETPKINIGIELISTILALGLLTSYFMVAFEGIKNLSSTDLTLPVIAGVVVVLANADILHTLIKTGVSHLHKIVTCRQSPSYLKENYPKLHTSLTATGSLISAISWAPSVYFAKEYFPKNLQDVAAPISATAIFFCSISATYTFRDKIIRQVLEFQNTDKVLMTQDRLTTLSTTIHKTSLNQMRTLFESFPEELQTRLDPRGTLTLINLSN